MFCLTCISFFITQIFFVFLALILTTGANFNNRASSDRPVIGGLNYGVAGPGYPFMGAARAPIAYILSPVGSNYPTASNYPADGNSYTVFYEGGYPYGTADATYNTGLPGAMNYGYGPALRYAGNYAYLMKK